MIGINGLKIRHKSIYLHESKGQQSDFGRVLFSQNFMKIKNPSKFSEYIQ